MMIKNKKQKTKRFHSALHEFEAHKKHRHSKVWLGVMLFFVGSFFTVQQNTSFLKVSILPEIQHPPFDGTVAPIRMSPDWVHLTAAEYKLPYDQIPSGKMQPLPPYKPEELQTPVENLKWNNPDHDRVRNSKITFSVPYMGSYRLNGKEYDGSHLAVDIKVPEKTPIFSMANGVITKVSTVSSGFGNHIVIQHNNVPSFNNPNEKTTIFSSYNHLSSVIATEGQVVMKGQLIGYSGSTGFSTTPHLHFQVDNNDAPWHPYWPFTYKEADDAGYNFVEALNAGVGKEKAMLMTISPMAYVEKYMQFSGSTPVQPAPEPNLPAAPVIPTASRFDFSHASLFQTTESINIVLTARDAQGNVLTNFDGDLTLLLTGNVGTLSKVKVNVSDFSNGQFTALLQEPKAGIGRLVALYQGGRFSSEEFQITAPAVIEPVVAPVEPAPVVSEIPPTPPPVVPTVTSGTYQFRLKIEGTMKVGRRVPAVIQIIDENGNVSRDYQPASLKLELVQGSADLSQTEFTARDFSVGEAPFSIAVKKAEPIVLKISDGQKESVNQVYEGKLFADIAESHPYYPAIFYLKEKSFIQGYDDGTFQPKKKVSRAEALKLILMASEKPVENTYNAPAFSDIDYKAWYGPYVVTAYTQNVARGYDDQTFRPSQKVTRAEFLKMLLSAMNIPVPSGVSEKPFRDVPANEWFAAYADFAKDKNLLPSTKTLFNPSEELDRGEVAEIIYRVLSMKEKNSSAFVADSR